jgi:hypothetical protein
MELPKSAKDELESMSEDELDFLEREVFYAYDQSYAAYTQDDADNLEELALYERALNTISSIRKLKQELDENKIEQGKEIRDLLNNSE